MASSDERRALAERLRRASACGESISCCTVDKALGLRYDNDFFGDVFTCESVRDLADLIDPTCHAVPSDGGFFTCSECGERIGAVLPTLGTVLMHHCSHCGARVVSSGGELHGITGTEIGKYRYVSDNEDGKEG